MKYSKALIIFIIFIALVLRFCRIQEVPPGLYIDEVSTAYNAYSVLTTGKDEHGITHPLWFQAFGEYKMPAQVYLTAGSIALFGKNEFAVRLPSAVAGTFTILVFYFLLKEMIFYVDRKLFEKQKIYHYLPHLSAFLLAITPWHLQFSRGGFEATIALLFYLTGWWLFLISIRKKKFAYLSLSFIFFVLTTYTYNAYRIIALLTIALLGIGQVVRVPKIRKRTALVLIIVVFLSLPILSFSSSKEGIERLSQTSTFSQSRADTVLEKATLYPLQFTKNYISHFSFQFLFTFGDGNGRHQMPGWGLLYRWELPFLLFGIFSLFVKRATYLAKLIFFLLLISPIAASLAIPSPHSLRSFSLVIPMTITVAMGIIFMFEKLRRGRNLFILVFSMIMVLEFIFYIHSYYVHYPKVNIFDWGGANKSIVEKTSKHAHKYKHIIIEKDLGITYVYFLFYSNTIRPLGVDVSWSKPKEWEGEKTLFIRRYYGPTTAKNKIDEARIPNQNNDIVAEFWEL